MPSEEAIRELSPPRDGGFVGRASSKQWSCFRELADSFTPACPFAQVPSRGRAQSLDETTSPPKGKLLRRHTFGRPITIGASVQRTSLSARRGIQGAKPLTIPRKNSADGCTSDSVLHGESNSYILERALGYGSSSIAYLATSPKGTRTVIKRMKNDDPECLNSLRLEFRLLRSLSHPHIIRASDASADMSWMALEFLDASQKLSARVRARGALCPCVGMVALRNLTSAVVYLHEHDVCHRDVKPENVLLVGEFGDLRLIDFNTARTDATDNDCLSPGGDLDYSAPEVLREGSSFAGDIWGVGATLYFALSGRFDRGDRFFRDDIWETMPTGLKRRITVCLEVDPARRPTAAALWKDLDSEVDEIPLSPPQKSGCVTPVVFP